MLHGRISVFVGKSGVGKSTLLNALQPGLGLKVKEVSQLTGKGRHTTSHLEMFLRGFLPGRRRDRQRNRRYPRHARVWPVGCIRRRPGALLPRNPPLYRSVPVWAQLPARRRNRLRRAQGGDFREDQPAALPELYAHERGLRLRKKTKPYFGDFQCNHCKNYVSANMAFSEVINRNHCPYCLHSKHVDLHLPATASRPANH